MLSAISFVTGVILETVTIGRREVKQLHYLAIGSPSCLSGEDESKVNRGAYSSFSGFASIAIALFWVCLRAACKLSRRSSILIDPVQLEQAITWRFDDWQSPFPRLDGQCC